MLLCEIMEIEALRLAIFIVDDFQIGDRLRLYVGGIGVPRLFALRLTLRLLRPLLVAGTFFLSLGKSCTRASWHKLETTNQIRPITNVNDSIL